MIITPEERYGVWLPLRDGRWLVERLTRVSKAWYHYHILLF